MAGDTLVVATSDPRVALVDLNRMRVCGSLNGHLLGVTALESFRASEWLISGSHDTFVRQETLVLRSYYDRGIDALLGRNCPDCT